MGDSGSTFIGALISGIIINTSSFNQGFITLLLFSTVLADPLFVVIRRIFEGHKLTKSHKLHLFQRLNRAGWNPKKIVLLYISLTVLLSMGYLLNNPVTMLLIAIFYLLFSYLIDRKFAVPFRD